MAVPSVATSTTSSASSAATLAKGANTAGIISAGGEAAGAVITAIGGIIDANKRRQFQENFSKLTLEQQRGLDLKILEAKTQSERLNILAQYLTQLNSQRISNLASFYSDKEKKQRTNLLIIAGGVALLGIIVTIVLLKNKK